LVSRWEVNTTFENFRATLAARRSIRHDRSGKVSAEGVGVGLIVLGGLLAFFATVMQVFLAPYVGALGWTWVYTAIFAFVGLLLLVVGAVIYGAE
jgi:hypothetical protein